MDRLAERTRAYQAECDIEDEASLKRFRKAWEPRPLEKLLSDLPSCPFLGLLDEEGRVGCLVHPKQNGGIDGRDCGVYDRHTCEDYLCAAHDLLTQDEKRLILAAVDESYLYGLVLTNIRLVKELVKRCAELNGASPRGEQLLAPEVVKEVRAFFELIIDWPFRAQDGIFGQIVAGEGLETHRREGPSKALGLSPDSYEGILTCLGTEVADEASLLEARRRVRERVEAVAQALG